MEIGSDYFRVRIASYLTFGGKNVHVGKWGERKGSCMDSEHGKAGQILLRLYLHLYLFHELSDEG